MDFSRLGLVRRVCFCFAIVFMLAYGQTPSYAADKIVVAKSVPFAWVFTPLDIGKAAGIWTKYGIDPDIIALSGGAKMAQALTAGSVDIGLSGGPEMGYMAKGVPAKGVAVAANEPRSMSLVVPYASRLSVSELRGKKVGVTTVGSLTAWMTRRISISQGWGPDGIQIVALGGGGTAPEIAAMKLGQVDALLIDPLIGFQLESQKEGKNLLYMNSIVKQFITHIIFARDELIKAKPDVVDRFLKGWFATIAYMRAHKKEAVEISARVLKQDPELVGRTYDLEMAEMSTDGSFRPGAVQVVEESLLEMHILPDLPKNDAMFTTRFVPVKP